MTEKLLNGIQKLNLTLSENQINQVKSYILLVLEFNKSYNIMKANNFDELAVNHILDSLVAVPHLNKLINQLCEKKEKSTLQIADIGSGGGCPGIPLAIFFDKLNFTLVERMEKRCNFLFDVVQKLGLKNVKIECKSVELISPESFDIEVFRAFHPFDEKITKSLLKMVKKNGFIVAYKAREEKITEEMNCVKNLIKDYNKIKLTVPFLEDHERNLVVIKK